MQEVYGENIIGVEELAKFLNVPPENTTKTMLYVTDTEQVVAVAIRGDYQINEIKLRKILGVKSVMLADEQTVKEVTGSVVGYAGLVGRSYKFRLYHMKTNIQNEMIYAV
jgi:prolyl-tRNA synthetase